MDFLKSIWQRVKEEPAMVLGFVQAMIVLAVTFGAKLTDEQTASILAASAMLLAVATRQAVVPLVGGKGKAGK